MRPAFVFALSLCLLLPLAAEAQFNITCADTPTAASLSGGQKAEGTPLLSKLDRGTPRLLLPYFEVDVDNPGGVTTLYAVRNLVDVPFSVRTVYFTLTGAQQVTSTTQTIEPRETLTVNIRDVAEPFLVDPDGFARGFALIEVPDLGADARGPKGEVLRLLGGDFFQITADEDFASGDRLLNIFSGDSDYYDLCARSESRFLNGGAFTGGSEFILFSDSVAGASAASNPTIRATIYDEAGNQTSTCEIRTDQFSTKFSASDLTTVPFGTAEFEFLIDVGQVLTTFSAQGRFSVGMRGLCTDTFP